MTIPEHRIESIFSSLKHVIKNLPYTSAREISVLCGKLISTKTVLGEFVQLKTRRLYEIITHIISWYSRVNIENYLGAITGLFFWRDN